MTIVVGIPGAQGIPGVAGTNGNTVWTTSGAPASTVGVNGDFADDPVAQVWYGPKAAGAWPAGVSYKGATGAMGPRGMRGISDRILSAGNFWQFASASPVLSDGTSTTVNALEGRYLPAGGGDLRVTLSNKNGTGSIVVTASVQWPTNLVPEPLTWNNAASVTIPAGQTVTSDPFNGALNVWGCPPPGTEVFFRYFITCASGVKFELNNSSGLGMQTGTTQTDQTLQQSFNYGTAGIAQFGMTSLIGTPLTASRAIVAVGDSITRGEGSSIVDGGPIYWACGGFTSSAYQWANAAIVGEPGAWFATNPTPRRQAMLKYADVIPICYGTNDIGFSSGTITLATLQATILKTWWACAGYGARVVGLTLLPRSTSTNSFIDLTHQTPVVGWGVGSTAALFNTWLRNGAPILNGVAVAVGTTGAIVAGQTGHPLSAVCDWCSVVEAGQGSGLWIINGTANYATADGTHPTDAAGQLMGALLQAAFGI
jgi:hypothetical protein